MKHVVQMHVLVYGDVHGEAQCGQKGRKARTWVMSNKHWHMSCEHNTWVLSFTSSNSRGYKAYNKVSHFVSYIVLQYGYCILISRVKYPYYHGSLSIFNPMMKTLIGKFQYIMAIWCHIEACNCHITTNLNIRFNSRQQSLFIVKNSGKHK